MAVIVATGGLALLVSGRAAAPAATATRAPLELVALGHVRADGQLVVTGLVQNPAAGDTVEQLEAQVRVFDVAGIMIATRSAARRGVDARSRTGRDVCRDARAKPRRPPATA